MARKKLDIKEELADIELYNGYISGAVKIINEGVENNDTDDQDHNHFTFFHLGVMNAAIECFHDVINLKLDAIDKELEKHNAP